MDSNQDIGIVKNVESEANVSLPASNNGRDDERDRGQDSHLQMDEKDRVPVSVCGKRRKLTRADVQSHGHDEDKHDDDICPVPRKRRSASDRDVQARNKRKSRSISRSRHDVARSRSETRFVHQDSQNPQPAQLNCAEREPATTPVSFRRKDGMSSDHSSDDIPRSDDVNYEPSCSSSDDSKAGRGSTRRRRTCQEHRAPGSSSHTVPNIRSTSRSAISYGSDEVRDEYDVPGHDEDIDDGESSSTSEEENTTEHETAHGRNGGKRRYTYVRRNKRCEEQSTMRKRWKGNMSELSDEAIKRLRCCRKRKCFRNVNVAFMRGKMQNLLSLTTENRRHTLHDMMGSNGFFHFDGKEVCSIFLVRAFRFSRDLQSSVRGSLARARRALNANEARGDAVPHMQEKDSVITYLERIADNTGDRMPDVNEVHLPFFKKTDVYDHFLKDFAELHSRNPPSFNYFCKIWRKYCPSVKVRKVTRFTKCSRCEELRAAIEDAVTMGKDATLLRKQKTAHREFIQLERREYKKKRENAILHPGHYCSIIVDGADQSAFGLPHFMVKTKNARGHAMKVKLVGLLDHKKPNEVHLMTMTEEHETGANHMVEAVHRFLMTRSKEGPLPRNLYVQLDNCTRENKNKFFLGYLEYLVAQRVFDTVEASFLPVGHTHEDVDQLFSRTSERLRSHDAVTMQEMHEQLRAVYNSKTTVRHMKYVANWSGLCIQARALAKVTHFSQYRYFHFNRRSVRGTQSNDTLTQCTVKVGCKDEWRPIRIDGDTNRGFLVLVPQLRHTPPTIISLPTGKEEISRRFDSEESRINNTKKLRELVELRDHVFRARTDIFHWDLGECVELQSMTALNVIQPSVQDADQEDSEDGSNARSEPVAVTTEDLIRNDFTYEVNSYVAVQTDCSDGAAFWLGKVSRVKHNGDGVVCEVQVHWLQLEQDGDTYEGKYSLSFLQGSSGSRKEPYKTYISADAVLVSFENMTVRGRLPVRVQKLLRTSENEG